MPSLNFDMETKLYNQNLKEIIKNIVRASLGLFAYGFGEYLSIKANIGVGPWEAFTLGLSGTLGLSYGTVAVSISLILLVANIMLKEQIGIGMLLDAFIVGMSVDMFLAVGLVQECTTLLSGLVMMLTGLVIMGFSVYFYMAARLGCGPRDSLMIALGKRLKRIPIGAVSIIIMVTVTTVGFFLGGPIGVGTLCFALLSGPMMQLAFKVFRFHATEVKHQNIFQSLAMARKSMKNKELRNK